VAEAMVVGAMVDTGGTAAEAMEVVMAEVTGAATAEGIRTVAGTRPTTAAGVRPAAMGGRRIVHIQHLMVQRLMAGTTRRATETA
jgi:hypothetical protein